MRWQVFGTHTFAGAFTLSLPEQGGFLFHVFSLTESQKSHLQTSLVGARPAILSVGASVARCRFYIAGCFFWFRDTIVYFHLRIWVEKMVTLFSSIDAVLCFGSEVCVETM